MFWKFYFLFRLGSVDGFRLLTMVAKRNFAGNCALTCNVEASVKMRCADEKKQPYALKNGVAACVNVSYTMPVMINGFAAFGLKTPVFFSDH